MGLGLYLTGKLPSRGLLRGKPDPKSIFLAIHDAVPDFFEDRLERRLMSGQGCGDTLQLQFHPVEQQVEFVVSGRDLTVDAKTSSCGPGYHAMLVDFLEHLGAKIGVEWQWRDDDEEPADETGYHGHRDFERLQLAMSEQLKATAEALLQHDDLNNIGVSVPFGFTVLSDAYAISPMGFWQKDWFDRIAARAPQDISDMAAEFYPWWSRERDARFWFNCGSVLCWIDLPWHHPTEDDLRAKYQLTLDCFARAGELDPGLPLPEVEIAEIGEILESDDCARVPRPDGIGFHRRMMQRDLTGEWTVALPGYFYEGSEQDEQTVLYWFGERTVRGSSLSFRSDDPDHLTNRGHAFVEKFKEKLAGRGESFAFQNGHTNGWACETRTEEPGESYWNLMGAIESGNNVCFVTIAYDDPEKDRPWAMDVMKSVSCPKS